MLMKHSLFPLLLSGSISDSSQTPSLPTSLHTNLVKELSQEKGKKVEDMQCNWGLRFSGCPALNGQESSGDNGHTGELAK